MNYSGTDWTTELRETGEWAYLLDELSKIGGDRLAYQPTTDPKLMEALGYKANHFSPYATTYGGNGVYGNFTPIQYDWDADELVKVLSKAELDKYAQDVMNGTRQDDLGLRLNGGYDYPTQEEALADAVRTNYLKKTVEHHTEKMAKRYADSTKEEKERFVDNGVYNGQGKVQNVPYLNYEPKEKQGNDYGRGLDILKNVKPKPF